MSDPTIHADPLLRLAEAICDEIASEDDFALLDAIMLADPDARRRYLDYCQLHFALRLDLRAQSATRKAPRRINIESADVAPDDHRVPTSEPSAIPVAVLGHASYTPFGYFASGWPVAYLVATVIFAVGLAVGALVHVSHPGNSVVSGQWPVVRKSNPQSLTSNPSPKASVVGRITGMVDCVWESGQRSAISGQQLQSTSHYPRATNHSVALGDRIALKSGLLEITYDSGAKVILQGPIGYEVESAAGGYLSVGKLTAKLEKKVASGRWAVARESETSSLSTNHYPLFTITTPTATVTDLGTEFGVEVDQEGRTTSHVFRGLVRVQKLGDGGEPQGAAQVLHENESVQVDGSLAPIVVARAARSGGFVRQMPRAKIKMFDLVDVVAGGDGYSGRRNAGIDPANGRATSTPPQIRETKYNGDNRYHRVEGLPFVDGVFVPDGRSGAVQIDSAGHTVSDFPATANTTACYLWVGGPVPMDNPYPSLTVLDSVDYAQPGRGLLFLHANKGITFDLEAIRKANPDWKPTRFCAVTGNTEKYSEVGMVVYADVWVLVDGQVRYRRREINGFSRAFSITIPIAANERFLTLAATDGNGDISNDWIIFGDPRLELTGSSLPTNDTK